MSNSIPSDTTQIILWLIVVGGVAAAALTAFFQLLGDWIARRREEYIDISKIKIEYISKSLSYYGQMTYFYSSLSHFLKSKRYRAYSSAFYLYHICNILRLRDEYFQKFGVTQLDNAEAETVIESIGLYFEYIVQEKMGYRSLSIMRSLGKKNLPYHEFEHELEQISSLPKEFDDKLLSDTKSVEELEKRCRWYYELMNLEINYSYRLWYGEEPSFNTLSPDTVDFLKSDYPLYLVRISSFKSWPLKRRLLHPIIWNKVKEVTEKIGLTVKKAT